MQVANEDTMSFGFGESKQCVC